jgi:hypothetical protein
MRSIVMAALLLVLSPVVADAQYYGWGGGGFFVPRWGGAGSTVAGSYAAGMGQVIRAQGMYNLTTSEAMINAEEARRRELENKQLATQTFFEMRRMNREYRAAEEAARRPERSPYDVRGQRPVASTRPTLNPSQLDPVTGEIAWPPALRDDAFAPAREQLEHLFMTHAQHSANPYFAADVRAQCDLLRQTLNARVMEVASQDFADANRFITALSETARLDQMQLASTDN